MLDAYRDLIDELLGTPSEIRGLIELSADSDSALEMTRLIGEIRDHDRAVLERAQTMTRQQNPYLTEIRIEQTPPGEDRSRVLEEMESARGDLVSLLINLSLKDWERVAIHETDGEITLADVVEDHVEFDEAQRQRLRDAVATR